MTSLLYDIAEKLKAVIEREVPGYRVILAAAPVITNRDFPDPTVIIIPYGFPQTELLDRNLDVCSVEIELMVGLVKYELGEWNGTQTVDTLVKVMEQVAIAVFDHDFQEDGVYFKEMQWEETYDINKLVDSNTFSSSLSVVYMATLERAGHGH